MRNVALPLQGVGVEDKTMTWNVWLLKTHTHDPYELIASYSNRGHAIAKLRGLMRRAQASELTYGIRR